MAFSLFTGGKHTRFPIVHRGYDPVAVDEFLDLLASGDPNELPFDVDDVMNKTFPVVKRGYDRARVHRYTYSLAGGGMEQIAA